MPSAPFPFVSGPERMATGSFACIASQLALDSPTGRKGRGKSKSLSGSKCGGCWSCGEKNHRARDCPKRRGWAVCHEFRDHGSCRFGDACRYEHQSLLEGPRPAAATVDEIDAFVEAAGSGERGVIERGILSGLVNETGWGPVSEPGWSALHWAAWKEQREIVKMLLAAGANVNAKEEYCGDTPLHKAATVLNCEIVRILLDVGAGLEVPGFADATPLLLVVQMEKCVHQTEIVKMLLAEGADPRARFCGLSASALALENDNEELALMLGRAEEDWNRSYVLQVSAKGTELTFRTIGGDIAATLTWHDARPAAELPSAVLAAIPSPEPLPKRASNLRLTVPQGCTSPLLDLSPDALSVLQQLSPV